MTRPPVLSILTPTLSSRHDLHARLLARLLPQAEAAAGGCEIVALHNDGQKTLREYRQALLDDARGGWVSFIDDDDLVAADFVPAIMAALAQDPDMVAFRHALYRDGTLDPWPVLTGLQYKDQGWTATDRAYICDITQVQPIRTSLARVHGFGTLVDGYEDRGYVWAVRPLLKTQAVIDRALFYYLHRSAGTVQSALPPHAYAPRPRIDSPAFRWHPDST